MSGFVDLLGLGDPNAWSVLSLADSRRGSGGISSGDMSKPKLTPSAVVACNY